jgi:hypothetical protein
VEQVEQLQPEPEQQLKGQLWRLVAQEQLRWPELEQQRVLAQRPVVRL